MSSHWILFPFQSQNFDKKNLFFITSDLNNFLMFKTCFHCKWIYVRSNIWIAEKEIKTSVIDRRGYLHNVSSFEIKASKIGFFSFKQ